MERWFYSIEVINSTGVHKISGLYPPVTDFEKKHPEKVRGMNEFLSQDLDAHTAMECIRVLHSHDIENNHVHFISFNKV